MGKDQGQRGTAHFWVGGGIGEGNDDFTGQDVERGFLTQGLLYPLQNPQICRLEAELGRISCRARSHPCLPSSCCSCFSCCFVWETLHPSSSGMTTKSMATTQPAAVPDEQRLLGLFGNSKPSSHPCRSKSQSDDPKQGMVTRY